MLRHLLAVVAVGSLALAGEASAAVYSANFNGPDLDPSFTVTEASGFVHTVGFGTLVLSSLSDPGPSPGQTNVYPSFSYYKPGIIVSGDYDAIVTVDMTQSDITNFHFSTDAGLWTEIYQSRPFGSTGTIAFDDFSNFFTKNLATTGNVFNLEILHKLTTTSLLVNGQLISSYYMPDQQTQFEFGLEDSVGIRRNYTTTFVRSFTVTAPGACTRGYAFGCVPGVPEPKSWALLIAGIGVTGAALRARRRRDGAVRPA